MIWITALTLLIELIIALVVGIISVYLGLLIFDRATKELDEWTEILHGNTAIGIVLGTLILGIGLIMRPALTIQLPTDVGYKLPLVIGLTLILRALIGLAIAIVAIILALWLFDRLTGSINEWEELRRGNLAVAIMLAGVILAISSILSPLVQLLFNAAT